MRGTFPVSNSGIRAAFEFLEAGLNKLGHSGPMLQRLSIMLDELCANMIRHDPKLNAQSDFTIELGEDDDAIVMTVLDPGQPFDPLDHTVTLGADGGGRGLLLIHSLSTEADYQRIEDQNRLRIVIRDGSG